MNLWKFPFDSQICFVFMESCECQNFVGNSIHKKDSSVEKLNKQVYVVVLGCGGGCGGGGGGGDDGGGDINKVSDFFFLKY